MYKKVSKDLNFVDREKEIEKFWEENGIFEKSMKERDGNDIYMSVSYTHLQAWVQRLQ